MTGQRGLNRVFSRFLVSSLSDEDDIGVLSEMSPQYICECQINLVIDLRLPS